MKKLTKVHVAIPAFNETKTILTLIESVLDQQQIGYTLKKITVYSDR